MERGKLEAVAVASGPEWGGTGWAPGCCTRRTNRPVWELETWEQQNQTWDLLADGQSGASDHDRLRRPCKIWKKDNKFGLINTHLRAHGSFTANVLMFATESKLKFGTHSA